MFKNLSFVSDFHKIWHLISLSNRVIFHVLDLMSVVQSFSIVRSEESILYWNSSFLISMRSIWYCVVFRKKFEISMSSYKFLSASHVYLKSSRFFVVVALLLVSFHSSTYAHSFTLFYLLRSHEFWSLLTRLQKIFDYTLKIVRRLILYLHELNLCYYMFSCQLRRALFNIR